MTNKEIEIQIALGTLSNNMKWRLSYNKRTSKKILTKLSTDKDDYVRYRVAGNPNTPEEVLTKLSTDKGKYVRIAANNCIINHLMINIKK